MDVPSHALSRTPESTREPLGVLAGKINALLQKSEDQRISAAVLLLEARIRVDGGEAGRISWAAWCRNNLERSSRDVRRLLALIKADDPAAKLEHERRAAREGMVRLRQRTNVSPVQAKSESLKAVAAGHPVSLAGAAEDPVSLAISAVLALSKHDRARFDRWYRNTNSRSRGAAVLADEVGIDSKTDVPPSPSSVDDESLLAALDALRGDDHKHAYDWVMRGDALGHELPNGRAGEYCALYLAACDERRRELRSQLTAR